MPIVSVGSRLCVSLIACLCILTPRQSEPTGSPIGGQSTYVLAVRTDEGAGGGQSSWTTLHAFEGAEVGAVKLEDIVAGNGSVRILCTYDDPERFALVPRARLEVLGLSDIPEGGTGEIDLAHSDLDGATSGQAVLFVDRAIALVRLPDPAQGLAHRLGIRYRLLPSPDEVARKSRTEVLPRRRDGVEPQLETAADPPYCAALAKAPRSDRMRADLDYLSTRLGTRYYTSPQMELACEYVFDQFQRAGLQASYDTFNQGGRTLKNVLGIKPGTVDPSRIYLLMAHLDSTSEQDTRVAPGAEDNGSGSAGVLESARILAALPSQYTIYFLCLTGEEAEEDYFGSVHFAKEARNKGLDIRAAIGLDMIAWYRAGGYDLWIEGFRTGISSIWLAELVGRNARTYTTLSTFVYKGDGWGSDHVPFHDQGYPAVLSDEYEMEDYPCYHWSCDTVDRLNNNLWRSITGANLVTLAQLSGVQASAGRIAGTVISGGKALKGASLMLSGTAYGNRSSNSSGVFSWDGVFPGTYAIQAQKKGYVTTTTTLAVGSGQTTPITIRMQKKAL